MTQPSRLKPQTSLQPGDSRILKRTFRVLRAMKRKLETEVTLRGTSWSRVFGSVAVEEQLAMSHFQRIVRDILKIPPHEISDNDVYITWNFFDSDSTGIVALRDCIGKMRRFEHFGRDSLVSRLQQHLPTHDYSGHATRIVDIADRFDHNAELTIAEMQTFLPRTEYEGFMTWFLADRAEAMKSVDFDKSMSLSHDEIENAYECYVSHRRQILRENRHKTVQLPKLHADPYYPGSLDEGTITAGLSRQQMDLKTLRDYKRISNYSSIDSQFHATIGVNRSDERLAEAQTQVAKLSETMELQSSSRKRFDNTTHSGIPRYQLTEQPIKAYAITVPEDAFVPTPYHGVRSINDDPVLIKGSIVPPSEQHFMQEVSKRRTKPLFFETMDPETHWSDRLASVPTNSFMVKMAERHKGSVNLVSERTTGMCTIKADAK